VRLMAREGHIRGTKPNTNLNDQKIDGFNGADSDSPFGIGRAGWFGSLCFESSSCKFRISLGDSPHLDADLSNRERRCREAGDTTSDRVKVEQVRSMLLSI
jgi:hypothetical protein